MYTLPPKKTPIPHFLHDLLSLPFGRRVVLIGSMVSIIFLFFPWFQEGIKWYNAFDKISVFGYSLFLCCLISLVIMIRETFLRRGYFLGISNNTLLLCVLGLGIYTVFLYTFSLYELLAYNPRAEVRIGGMFLFFSLGLSFGGALLTQSFFPKQKEKKLIDTPDKVDTSKTSLSIEKQPLFTKHD